MRESFIKEGIGWGFLLWLIGYILGIVFFMFVPPNLLGWAIMPIGASITLWVLSRKIESRTLSYYVKLAMAWTALALVLDYLFIVLLLRPEDGYYKLDVYLYYALTAMLPVVVGWYKSSKAKLAQG